MSNISNPRLLIRIKVQQDQASQTTTAWAKSPVRNIILSGKLTRLSSNLIKLGGKLMMALLGLLLLVHVCIPPALSAMAVIDAKLISEEVKQRSLMVKQWAKDNEQQLKQLNELIISNNQLLTTHNLMAQNYTMNSQSTWQDISTMQEQSLALLYATKSLWGEYGSAQRYYADHLKAQAWESCMATHNCNFNLALKEMNDLNLAHALQAYENAAKVSKQLDQQINSLKKLSVEGLNSQSLAATIDAMAKINGSIAVSMVDLNNQLALFTQMMGQDISKKSQTETIDEKYREIITDFTPINPMPIKSTLQ